LLRFTNTHDIDHSVDPKAYKAAIAKYKPGDCAIIFTPDDTHYEIAKACVSAGLHTFVTKPIVKTLADHKSLAALSRSNEVICAVEVHKRLDPFYADARDRIRNDLNNNIGNDFQYL